MKAFRTWLVREFREVIPPAIFFLIGFHMLALTRSLMLREYGVHAAAAAGATVGALLVAKVVLIADSLPVINRFPERPLVYNVAWKTTIYVLAALVVHYLEHLVPLWWRLGDLGAANHRLLGEIVWPHFWVVQLWLVVLLFMYCAMRELIRAIGPREVRRMFFGSAGSGSRMRHGTASGLAAGQRGRQVKKEERMSSEDGNRSHLPIPDRPRTGLITYDAKDPETKYPPIEQLRPPKGAPNILVILIDDAGFGASSAFGGPCQTPNAERLAAGGLKYTRFHTTALCSPTRQALLTGRNHHSVGMGGITEIASGSPGYSSVLPNTAAPIAKTLKLNGYATAQFGKCHEVPVWETSPAGPFNAWPTGGGGFEYFYGFIGGEAHQWYPSLYEGTTPIEVKTTPEEGYHFMADMTDKAIGWIGQQRALMPDKPFFVYFAPGATHAPHHVPKEWADKYKGQVRRGLGHAARGDHRAAEGAGRHPAGLPAHRAPQGDPRVGRDAG